MMTTIPTEIAAFADEVREALADLPADEVDELTDGLEADLTEAYADNGAMPDPVAYAAELRAAAGLPARVPHRSGLRGAAGNAMAGWHRTRDDLAASLRRNPAAASMLDFLAVLRPVWWIVRAWVAYQFIAAFFGSEGPVLPYEAGWWIVLMVLVVVSVQWGRKLWRIPVLTPVIVVGNLVAVVALLPLLAVTNAWSAPYEDAPYFEPEPPGLAMNGESVSNIYAYDAQGRPLSNVQLFAQDGRPLDLVSRGRDDGCIEFNCDEPGLVPQPVQMETGEKVGNVFPLSFAQMMWDGNGNLVPDDTARARDLPKPPFLKVPKVASSEGSAGENRD